ncbi:MAG: hypothetical protein QNJ37_17470 [Crocosphaera sp.]|nr:hypothetical protein [Crocosphaera sp.]
MVNIHLTGLKPEQISQIQAMIEQFKTQNLADNSQLSLSDKTPDIIDILTDNPILVDSFLSREEIYDRSH